jgi:signal transduction histidine kinase
MMVGKQRHRWSLRLRITVGALVVVVTALSAAGLVLVDLVEREMVAQVDSTLHANADFIDRSMRSGAGLPTGEGPTDLYVQFIAADGRVLGASTAAQGRTALAESQGGESERIVTLHEPVLGDLRVLAKPAPTDSTTTLVVARSASSVSHVRDSLVRVLVVIVVAGSVLLGFLIWVVVGRALRPVDRMRTTVDAISERDLRQRLEAPGTGDELDRLAGTLNELLERLGVAVTRERQFVADASHELRTPIAGVRALLETEPADPGSVVQVRAEALARLRELQDLVEELLVLAKADAAALDVPTRPVDLDELVLGQARQLGRTTSLRIDTANVSGGQVAGRDTDLVRVVENLATNAARHAETMVAFSVRQIDGEVEFTVTDDGPGIAPSDRDRIFERFSILEDGRSSADGRSGLGLPIASAIVMAYRGSIRAEDAPGTGTRFVVRLPTAAATTPVEASS